STISPVSSTISSNSSSSNHTTSLPNCNPLTAAAAAAGNITDPICNKTFNDTQPRALRLLTSGSDIISYYYSDDSPQMSSSGSSISSSISSPSINHMGSSGVAISTPIDRSDTNFDHRSSQVGFGFKFPESTRNSRHYNPQFSIVSGSAGSNTLNNHAGTVVPLKHNNVNQINSAIQNINPYTHYNSGNINYKQVKSGSNAYNSFQGAYPTQTIYNTAQSDYNPYYTGNGNFNPQYVVNSPQNIQNYRYIPVNKYPGASQYDLHLAQSSNLASIPVNIGSIPIAQHGTSYSSYLDTSYPSANNYVQKPFKPSPQIFSYDSFQPANPYYHQSQTAAATYQDPSPYKAPDPYKTPAPYNTPAPNSYQPPVPYKAPYKAPESYNTPVPYKAPYKGPDPYQTPVPHYTTPKPATIPSYKQYTTTIAPYVHSTTHSSYNNRYPKSLDYNPPKRYYVTPKPYKYPVTTKPTYKDPHPKPVSYKHSYPSTTLAPYKKESYHDEYSSHKYKEKAAPYKYQYGVSDVYHGTSYGQFEVSDGDQVKGEYRVQLPDGRLQIVSYTADHEKGYVPTIRYEGQQIAPAAHIQYNPPNPKKLW
ncbi:unnamed protein product, partial [Meganyctiphanes norvegica]